MSEYIGSCGYQDDFLLENGKYLQLKTNYNIKLYLIIKSITFLHIYL